jgi:hypothetical protein
MTFLSYCGVYRRVREFHGRADDSAIDKWHASQNNQRPQTRNKEPEIFLLHM